MASKSSVAGCYVSVGLQVSLLGFLLLLPAASGKVAFDWMKRKVTKHFVSLFFGGGRGCC